jgi:hypothetical protein
MLVMFRAKNFSSFHKDVILDMRATSYKEHPTHVVMDGKFKILKTAVIYGANASGKSNLISALSWFERYIFNQLYQEKWDEALADDQSGNSNLLTIEPFLLSDKTDPVTEFEMIFSHKNTLYQYGYSFQADIVHTEWLHIDNELVFNRNANQKIAYGKKYKAQLKEFKKFREDRLYLSVLDYFATDSIKESIDNFKEFFQEKFNVYSELLIDSSVKGMMGLIGLKKRMLKDEDFLKKIGTYINQIDVGILDLAVEYESVQITSGEFKNKPIIKTIHEIYDEDGNKVGTKRFLLKQESTGTLRFLSFIQNILLLLENGGVFIIDELTARLHPMLTKFIVEIFQSVDNNQNAQLIFTTHDTSILNKDQFRRDEILFVDKNHMGESSLYSLADLKQSVRQDATYYKDYFNGKYGAIPIFKSTQYIYGGDRVGETETIR